MLGMDYKYAAATRICFDDILGRMISLVWTKNLLLLLVCRPNSLLPPILPALAGSRWTKKAALNIADFECSTLPKTFKISAAFFVHCEAGTVLPRRFGARETGLNMQCPQQSRRREGNVLNHHNIAFEVHAGRHTARASSMKTTDIW